MLNQQENLDNESLSHCSDRRTMPRLQAREDDPHALKQAQAVESRRKLMEELLTLKQEVTQLRRAAELNEEAATVNSASACIVAGDKNKAAAVGTSNQSQSGINQAILIKFREQIQALRVSQDEL